MTSNIIRTATVLLALLLAAVPASAQEQLSQLSIGTLPIDPTAEVYYAQEMGFFKKAGLNVTITAFNSGGAVAAAMVGGAVDVGLTDVVSMITAHSHGVPLTYLAPASVYKAGAETYYLAVKIDSPIKGAKDLAGKVVAVNGLKNVNEIPTDAWIDNNGGDSRATKFTELPFPAMLPALDAGKVDAAAIVEPFSTFARSAKKYRLISLAEKNVAPAFMTSGWSTTKTWAATHPDVVKKFIAAMLETAKWANVNHRESAQILVKIAKIQPDLANRMERAYYGERLDSSLLQPMIDACARYGVIAKPFLAAELIDPNALK